MSSEKLDQVEPDDDREFVPRPFSLTPGELSELPVTMAKAPTPVLAWVRYPAVAVRVRGLARAWTPRAVYIEWNDRGTHRAWVWASAVERDVAERASEVDASTTTAAPTHPEATAVTVLGTETLVQLVNDELALLGSELAQAMAKPTGPFSSVVFGIIDGHHVQLHFLTEPATEMCGVLLASKEVEVLPGQRTGTTFEAAIQEYPWAEAVEALEAN